MRLHYAKKYQQLINSCEKYLPSEIKRYTHSVGLHISLQFPKNYSSNNEKQFIKLLNENHLFPVALSTYYYKDMQMGIVLGFGMISCEKIDISIKKLAKLYRQRMLE
jgi:DNA-binding transcriptional MocR family regulator